MSISTSKFCFRQANNLLATLLVVLGTLFPLRVLSSNAVEEYVAKAALTFNFARYTEWPAAAVANSPAILRVCVVGDDAVVAAFQAINGKPVGQRQIRVSALHKLDKPGGCDVIFVNIRDRRKVSLLLGSVHDHPILTIGELPDFTDYGGIINLYRSAKKIRFEINLAAASKANLAISSRLLRLAKVTHQ